MSNYDNAMPEQVPKGTYEELYVEALKREQAANYEIERLRKANQDCVAWEKACKADLDRALARADACQQEAKIWKQEARTQSAIVAEIYQELTGKTGEPGDWNGARPLRPAILRKQAEAIEAVAWLASRKGTREIMSEHISELRKKADQLENTHD